VTNLIHSSVLHIVKEGAFTARELNKYVQTGKGEEGGLLKIKPNLKRMQIQQVTPGCDHTTVRYNELSGPSWWRMK